MIIMPVVVRSDLRWSPYHLYFGKDNWLLTSLHYLPKTKELDIKQYLSQDANDVKEEHFPLDGVEDSHVFIDNGVFSKVLKGEQLPTPRELAATYNERIYGADLVAAGADPVREEPSEAPQEEPIPAKGLRLRGPSSL